METNLAELFIAVLSSRKFTKFFDGVEFTLPDGKKTKIKIESYHKGTRLDGFRFSKFSFEAKAVSDDGVEGYPGLESRQSARIQSRLRIIELRK